MGVYDLRLQIAAYKGGDARSSKSWQWIPSSDPRWMEIFFAGSMGGAKRAFSVGNVFPLAKGQHAIVEEMEVGDEMRQIINQGNLSVWRFSDAYSLDVRDLSGYNLPLFVRFKVYMDSGGKAMKSAELHLHNARVKFGRAVKGGKNVEGLEFRFPKEQASVQYGERARADLQEQALRLMAGRVGSALSR